MNDHRQETGTGMFGSWIILFLLIISLTPSMVTADTMFHADPQHTGVFENGGIVLNNSELWKLTTGEFGSPVVANGVVYVSGNLIYLGGSSQNNLYAIDAVAGKETWRFQTGGLVDSSPAVANGVVYVGSADDNLYAVDAVTGKEKWRFTTGGLVDSSPAVANGVVYIGGGFNANLYAVDAVTGNEIWRFTAEGDRYSSPAVSNGVVYVGNNDKNLYAVDAVTGKEKWRFATGDAVSSSPAVSNGVVYVGSNDKNLYAVDAVTGKEMWRFATGDAVSSSPAVSNGVVYVGSNDKNLYAVDAVTGKETWRFDAGGLVESSPAVAGSVVYVGSRDNNLYAIDAVTGKEVWKFGAGSWVISSPVVANGVVYIVSWNGTLYAVGSVPSTPSLTAIVTQKNPTIVPPSDNNLTLPITVVLIVLFLAGGGYVIVRMKRKPGEAQHPDHETRSAHGPPPSQARPPSGKYPESIRAREEQQGHTDEITRLKEKGRKLLVESEQFGTVPERVRSQLGAQDIPTLEYAIKELEAFRTTMKPEITIDLDHTRLIAGEWDKLGIYLANRGDAHVNDIQLSFSNEFDTKLIKPASIKAGATTSLEIGILAKTKGKVPLEVTALFRDYNDRKYHEVHAFWIDVIETGKDSSPPSGTPPSPASQFPPGPFTQKQLPAGLMDRYTESEFIGKGGFARVFRAKRKDGKYVAVKIPISLDEATGKSFIAEIQNWTRLNHPNIVKIYDFNIMPLPYFEMELCDSSLAEVKKPIESEEAAWIIFNVAEGLKLTHSRKIVHRDLKPQNILMKEGTPKISDWGLSRVITESSVSTATSFTPFYAAPEQINNRVKDERTDIWQLGVILYELVTGVLPFKGDSMVEVGMSIATKDPVPPGEIIPGTKAFEAVVLKCLLKEPAMRYQSVLELQKDLAMYLRQNYTELLNTSVSVKDYSQSAYYCGDLVMINMLTGDMATAYKYLLDLVRYSKGDVEAEVQELSEQLKMRMEMGITEIPEELIQKADLIVHQVTIGFRKKG